MRYRFCSYFPSEKRLNVNECTSMFLSFLQKISTFNFHFLFSTMCNEIYPKRGSTPTGKNMPLEKLIFPFKD